MKTIKCKWCDDADTTMLGTEECDRCWELRSQIERDVASAKKMIAVIEGERKSAAKYKGVVMDDEEFRAFLDLLMRSDLWPADAKNPSILIAFAEKEASKRMFGNWIEAYHMFKK